MLRSKEKVMPLISALLHFPFSLLHSVLKKKKRVFNQPASTGFLANQIELFFPCKIKSNKISP